MRIVSSLTAYQFLRCFCGLLDGLCSVRETRCGGPARAKHSSMVEWTCLVFSALSCRGRSQGYGPRSGQLFLIWRKRVVARPKRMNSLVAGWIYLVISQTCWERCFSKAEYEKIGAITVRHASSPRVPRSSCSVVTGCSVCKTLAHTAGFCSTSSSLLQMASYRVFSAAAGFLNGNVAPKLLHEAHQLQLDRGHVIIMTAFMGESCLYVCSTSVFFNLSIVAVVVKAVLQ